MKTLFLALFLTFNINSNNCEDLTKIRNLFEQNIQKEKELLSMIEVCKNSACDDITPYYAVAIMKKAEHAWNPMKKMAYFKEGKNMLETFINEHPKNIEARYVRWLTQKKAPSVLGYNSNLKEDLQFVEKNISKSDIEKDYQKVMLHHIEKIKNE